MVARGCGQPLGTHTLKEGYLNFQNLGSGLRDLINLGLDRLIKINPDGVEALGRMLAAPVRWLEWILLGASPLLIVALVALLGLRVARSVRFGAVMGGLVAALWLLDLWIDALRSLALILVAMIFVIAFALPLGVAGARYRYFGQISMVAYDLMQTVPSFVYLIPAAMVLGLGTAPALLATIIVAVPPLARLTSLGLRSVREHERDAARALGLSPLQSLWLVELPLARPSIMAGLNQSVLASLGMVVIASMIGAKGLGETVLVGLQRADAGQGAVGGLGIVILAILIDRLIQAAGRPRWLERLEH